MILSFWLRLCRAGPLAPFRGYLGCVLSRGLLCKMNSFAPILVTALATGLSGNALRASQPYAIVDTGQTNCYDNRKVIAPPKPGQPFYGQDAQFPAHPASYTLSADGLTVRDNVTSLTWQRSSDTDGDGALTPRDKLTLSQARALPAKLNAAKFGGFDDWRLPSIKELYSLFDARGTDPSGPMDADTARLRPFIDTRFFKFVYGDPRTGERVIDSQYASSTRYVGKSVRNYGKLFGVNFADGRIKGYDLLMPGRGSEKTFFVICVRGNPAYGKNDFYDNGDGTITDHATGLMWSRTDSGQGMNWQGALAWVQKKNAEKIPRPQRLAAAERQGVAEPRGLHALARHHVTRPPLIPIFICTTITNGAHQVDYPYYWSGTTHAGLRGGNAAMYVAFGRAAGWMSPRGRAGGPPGRRGGFGPGPQSGFGGPPDGGPPGMEPQGGEAGGYHYVDVHGAGAQRSDPKAGDPAMFPHGRGPQGNVIRIYNFVRLVRGGLK